MMDEKLINKWNAVPCQSFGKVNIEEYNNMILSSSNIKGDLIGKTIKSIEDIEDDIIINFSEGYVMHVNKYDIGLSNGEVTVFQMKG